MLVGVTWLLDGCKKYWVAECQNVLTHRATAHSHINWLTWNRLVADHNIVASVAQIVSAAQLNHMAVGKGI